jgi:hypothetical protein
MVYMRDKFADKTPKNKERFNPQNPCPPILTTHETEYNTIGYILDNDVFLTAAEKVSSHTLYPISLLSALNQKRLTHPLLSKTDSKTLLPQAPSLGNLQDPRQNRRNRILPLSQRRKRRKAKPAPARKEKSQEKGNTEAERNRAGETRSS